MWWGQVGCLVLCVAGILNGSSGSLHGHKVVRAIPETVEQLHTLAVLLQNATYLDIWRYPSSINAPVDIRLSPIGFDDVMASLRNLGLRPAIMIRDIAKLLTQQRHDRDTLKFMKSGDFQYNRYHSFEEILDWMNNITHVYKDIVTPFHVTYSSHGRPLKGLKISTSSTCKRPAFWIQGGIHAREWISPATVIYMTGKLLDYYKLDPQLSDMLDKFDWYILPVTNPDGYAYTWTSDKARLWRKTMSGYGQGKVCFGVDPNRNWDIDWCKVGASKDPCSDAYCGPKAFSEVEVKGVADFIKDIPNITAFIDFHSYSQIWMSPWAFTSNLPHFYSDQVLGSKIAVDALRSKYGTKFEYGSVASILYTCSGTSSDWTYGKAKIKFSYAVELRDTGTYGFLLPEKEIIPSGEETLAGLQALAEYVVQKTAGLE